MQSEGSGPDPMLSMSTFINDAYDRDPSSLLVKTLKSWLPENDVEIDNDTAIRSLSVFLNVTQQAQGRLLNERPSLRDAALRFSGDGDATWLPCLPIERIDGFVGHNETRFLAVSITGFNEQEKDDSNPETAKLLPKTKWTTIDRKRQLPYQRADSEAFQLLGARLDKFSERFDLPSWIADSFENLVGLSSDGMECAPIVRNLLTDTVESTDENMIPPVTTVLGYSVPSHHFDSQAFVRSSNQQLVPQTVYANGARYWRAGIAITDALGLLEEVFYDPLKSILRPSHSVALDEDEAEYRWAMEKLVRFSLQRLCGVTTNSSYIREDSGVPRSLQRVLERLRRFPKWGTDHVEPRTIAAVLAAVFETRFAAARFSDERDQAWEQKSGAAVSVLAEIARRVIYTDRQLAARLPRAEMKDVIKRRNVSAWLSLAARIHRLAELIYGKSDAIQTPLLGLCHGLAFSGLGALLRCLALETIAAEDGLCDGICSLKPSSVSLSGWHLDGFELLTYDRTRPNADDPERTELEKLLLTLKRGIADDNSNQARTLEKITPLGWAVVLGIATGYLRSDLKLSFLQADHSDPKSNEMFKAVCDLLKPAARDIDDGEDADDPWYGLASVLERSTFQKVLQLISRLEEFGESTGLHVSEIQISFRFRMEPTEHDADPLESKRRSWDVSLDEATYELETWRIASASTANESQSVPAESVRAKDQRGNLKPHYYWTETRSDGQLIGVHVAKPGLADLAGFHLPAQPENEGGDERTRESETKPTSLNDSNGNNSDTKEQSSAEQNIQVDGLPRFAAYNASATPSSRSQNDGVSEWKDLTRYQNLSWAVRAKSDDSHYKRIAFIQWQVEDYGSYRHPFYECSEQRLSDATSSTRGEHKEPIEVVSYVEHRRRCILDKALRACKAFKVDMLLLPEYSTRPETIDWLLGEIRLRKLDVSIWAGTFRLPPFYSTAKDHWTYSLSDWASVLPIIEQIPGKTGALGSFDACLRLRRKKYPSIAYNEVFDPDRTRLDAKTESSTQVVELICSEIFLASSPTNLMGLRKTWDDLCQQFGSSPKKGDELVEYILKDFETFARSTTMCNKPGERRSILFVPAMTPRTVDYTVLGQASYLAAGLTTVFCNDSGRHAHGQSCFIGQDGWDRENEEADGLPGTGPYHGVTPGLYRPSEKGRGWLGQHEQAMVIADVDPLYQAEGKPRPQNLMPPLKLIAHLPIFEVGRVEDEKKSKYGNVVKLKSPIAEKLSTLKWPDPGFWKNQSIAEISDRRHVISTLLTLLSNHIATSGVSPNTISDVSHRETTCLLGALAAAAPENAGWLERRANAYRIYHALDPRPYPPPVALDWLYVDLNVRNIDEAKIWVPPLSCPPASVS
ncbi:hypothetical protein Enr13x_23490 [Stieleria neptunia]|uniref:Uncharacterized protein n=2 Tax=Stieleria neptunia TaxID=2527979 RepID=A0A518HNU9_9BACT|nr:hypothetical protein Enr13x_23490 [Stieleria neptunia]